MQTAGFRERPVAPDMASWTFGRLSPGFIFLVSRKLSQRVASTLNCPKKCALLFHFTFIYLCLYFSEREMVP